MRDRWSTHFWLRQLQLETIDGKSRLSVNGRPVYVRGAVWLPTDLLRQTPTHETYAQRLRQVREAGVNLLRLWDGLPDEKEVFYEACSELGVMVWQDAGLCGEDETAERPGRALIRRLCNQACMTFWSVGGETVDAETNEETRKAVFRSGVGMSPGHAVRLA